jgi:hypothetical protein
MSDPLADIRAKLKAKQPAAKSKISADPLAKLRAKLKAGKGLGPTPLFTDATTDANTRLTRLELVVKALSAKLPSTELAQLAQQAEDITS